MPAPSETVSFPALAPSPVVSPDAELRSHHFTVADQLRHDAFGDADRTANPTPTDPPAGEKSVELIRSCYPAIEQGPILITGVDRGVGLNRALDRAPVTRANRAMNPLMTPVVSVRSKPKGLPMAKTFCPTMSLSNHRADDFCSLCSASTLITARSVSGSRPTPAPDMSCRRRTDRQPLRVRDHMLVCENVPDHLSRNRNPCPNAHPYRKNHGRATWK